jgi:hypothetical protein
MSSLPPYPLFPRIACRPGEAILSFGLADELFSDYPEFGPSEGFSILAIAGIIPTSLRRIIILLGHRIRPAHDRAFRETLNHTLRNCPRLESVLIVAYVASWTDLARDIARQWKSGAVTLYEEHIIDSQRNSEVRTYWRKLPEPSTAWKPESFAAFSLDLVSEYAEDVCQLPQLEKLSIRPPRNYSTFHNNRESILLRFASLLSRLPELRNVSLPLDIPDLLFRLASSLRHPCAIELITPPTTQVTPTTLLASLTAGFRNFDLLQNLSIPGEVLSDALLSCLGDLRGLRTQTITGGSVPPGLQPHAKGKFSALRRWRLLGTACLLPDIEAALRAFVPPRSSAMNMITVEAESLRFSTELGKTLGIVHHYCPRIEELNVSINGTTNAEGNDWVDLSPLPRFSLKVFTIKHPRPIPLTDEDIGRLLGAWRSAEFVSLNPRPTSHPGYSGRDRRSPFPTLDCLKAVAKEGRKLRHFGICLDPLPPYSGCADTTLSSLRELDLGVVEVHEAFWKPLFPRAVRL